MTPPTPSSIHKARSIHADAQSSSEQIMMEEPELVTEMEREEEEERLFVGGEKEARTVCSRSRQTLGGYRPE